jgi:MFS family permease
VSALAGGAQAVLPDFPLLMGLRVVEGAGHLLLVVAVPTLMAALAAEKDRALVMGVWATFFGVGLLACGASDRAGRARRRSSPSTGGLRRCWLHSSGSCCQGA